VTHSAHAQFKDPAFWKRALFMLGSWIAYSITEVIIGLIVVVQFLIVMFTGRANDDLLRFGNSLSAYVRQILRYVLFNSEYEPFPFSDFPDEPPDGERWRGAARDARDAFDVADVDDAGTPDAPSVPGEPDAGAPVPPKPPEPPVVRGE
jgi:hypothetical protein